MKCKGVKKYPAPNIEAVFFPVPNTITKLNRGMEQAK